MKALGGKKGKTKLEASFVKHHVPLTVASTIALLFSGNATSAPPTLVEKRTGPIPFPTPCNL
jgi:hypothetical protein